MNCKHEVIFKQDELYGKIDWLDKRVYCKCYIRRLIFDQEETMKEMEEEFQEERDELREEIEKHEDSIKELDKTIIDNESHIIKMSKAIVDLETQVIELTQKSAKYEGTSNYYGELLKENNIQINKMTLKIIKLTDYGMFSEEDIKSIDEQVGL